MTSLTSAFSWSGFYVGGFIGGGDANVSEGDYWCDNACDAPTLNNLFANIGVDAGYEQQFGSLVVGVEATLGSGFANHLHVTYSTGNNGGADWDGRWDWLASIRGKIGLAVDNTMVYLSGGPAFAMANHSVHEWDNGFESAPCTDTAHVSCASFNGGQMGAVVAVGVETALTDQITLNAEGSAVFMPTVSGHYSQTNNQDEFASWTAATYGASIGAKFHF